MTRKVDESTLDWKFAELNEQQRAREHVKRVFGREPESVLIAKRRRELCFVRVRFGISGPVEFILANGLLIAIPPRTPWKS